MPLWAEVNLIVLDVLVVVGWLVGYRRWPRA